MWPAHAYCIDRYNQSIERGKAAASLAAGQGRSGNGRGKGRCAARIEAGQICKSRLIKKKIKKATISAPGLERGLIRGRSRIMPIMIRSASRVRSQITRTTR